MEEKAAVSPTVIIIVVAAAVAILGFIGFRALRSNRSGVQGAPPAAVAPGSEMKRRMQQQYGNQQRPGGQPYGQPR